MMLDRVILLICINCFVKCLDSQLDTVMLFDRDVLQHTKDVTIFNSFLGALMYAVSYPLMPLACLIQGKHRQLARLYQ